jgi:cold shock CspA family protein
MSKGTVKEYKSNRGYGTIIDGESLQKLTVYANYLDLKEGETLAEGQVVEYKIHNSRQGHWAINVRIIN